MKDTFKDDIIISATKQFKAFGPKTVSMQDIAFSLNISKKTLYQYYSSKQNLLQETLTTIFNNHFEKIERILDKDMSPLEKFILIYNYGILQMVTYNPSYFYELKKYYYEIHEEYNNRKNHIIYNIIHNLLADAQNQGEILKEVKLTLFCELYLYNLDSVLANRRFKDHYEIKTLLNHLIIYNLRGIATNPQKIRIP